MRAFLDSAGGDFLFSTTGGEKPINGFGKAKEKLDDLMRMDLEAQGLPFEPFVIHDITPNMPDAVFCVCLSRTSSVNCSWHMPDQGCTKFTTYIFMRKKKQMRLSFGMRS